MVQVEPYKLRRWRRGSSNDSVSLYTCARPGRSKGKNGSVSDRLVDKWVQGLPGNPPRVIVSLLGRKPTGLSEFSFYSFAGEFETPKERGRRPLFLDWLLQRHPGSIEKVIEYPTTDFSPVEEKTLAPAATDINVCLSAGRTVVLMDSGGETRIRQLCNYAGFVEDPRK